MSKRPRVGFHDFYNSKPLLHALRRGLVETPFDLVIDTPSRLADRFSEGDLDIALIPSIEYARVTDAVISPVLCISSLGKVDTVLLFSELAIEDIESVAVDPKSRASAAMLKILFKEQFGKELITFVGEEEPEMMLRSADAGLVIGDLAFGVDREKYVVNDLGELWYNSTGRPFVHAVLCLKEGQRFDSALASLKEAREIGEKNLALIAKQETDSEEEAEVMLGYLTSRIFYDLGVEEIKGLEYFLASAKKLGLCDRSDLKFYQER
jgi:chorismate dehydratase